MTSHKRSREIRRIGRDPIYFESENLYEAAVAGASQQAILRGK